MDYFELECVIEEWAEDKGILEQSTPMAQALKTLEECTELCTAINKNDRPEIIDAIGDIMVTLIIQAKMQGLTLEECLESAYNVISKRTGKMIDGQFVKDN
jgi:NTP pyrophosphatase (non-canonical NTP hydrolase)